MRPFLPLLAGVVPCQARRGRLSLEDSPSVLAVSAAIVIAASGIARAQTPGFYLIGKLGGQGTEIALPTGIGPGPSVVGTNDYQRNTGNFRRAFRWTPAAGMNPLAGTPSSGTSSGAYALSADGRVLVGVLGIAPGASGQNPQVFRRIDGGPDEPLPLGTGMTFPQIKGVSAAGDVTVGYVNGYGGGGQAVMWLGTSAPAMLPNLAGATSSQALGVSADGLVVVGWSGQGFPFDNIPARWINGRVESLGLPPGCNWGWACAASSDGSKVVGYGWVGGLSRAWQWTAATGITLLEDGPTNFAEATSISDDGRLIGGRMGAEAVVWRDGAPHSIQAELIPAGTVIAPITALSGTVIMSHDGRVVAGSDSGTLPGGDPDYYAWTVILPESFVTPETCYANCDNSTITPVLNVNDFTCFLNKFAAGDSYANCDGSTTAPVLNVNDFTCFLNKFAAGCP